MKNKMPQLGVWTRCHEQLPEDSWVTRETFSGGINGKGNVTEEDCLVSIHDTTEPPPLMGVVSVD